MISFTIEDEIARLRRDLRGYQHEQIPFGVATGLTRAAQTLKAEEIEEMQKVFDRPTRFTLNSLFVKRATKKRLEAVVWLKDWAAKGTPATKYLEPQIEGGKRKLKGYEVLLNARGILPDGYYAVPSKKARKDRFGNINKGLLNQILSYSGAQRDRAQNTKQGKKRQTKARFIVLEEQNGKPGGIWQIDGNNNLFPILIFVKNPSYSARFDFHGVAKVVANRDTLKEVRKGVAYAIKTARKK